MCDATQGTTLRNITNYARVDATTTSASNGNYIGGICAYNDATVGATNCKNYGHISYSSPSTSSWVNVAGCFGHTTKEITLEGCENHGLVQFLGTNSGNKSLNLAGISGGCMSLTLKSCKNNGKIECKATKTHSGGTNIGGFIGLVNSRDVTTTFENCENTTNGTLINSSQSGSNVAIGGSIGNIMGSTSENNPFSSKVSISNFKNYGAIQNTATVSGILALGGIAGMISTASENHISSCENHGEIINTGGFSSRLYLGGIVGLLNNASTNISNVKNSGNLETTKGSAKTDGTGNIAMGGILGATVSTAEAHAITNAQNSGNLSFKTAETKDGLQMGGILGFCEKSNITIGGEIENNLINSGNITSTKKSRHLGIGGVVGRIFGSATVNTIQNANNTGAVNHTSWLDNGAQPMWHGIGGILGAHSTEVSSTSTINVKKCHNEGRIDKLGGDGTVNDIHVGGIIGNIASIATTDDSKCESIGNIEDCTNSGIICNDSGKGTGNGKYAATGGIIGQMWCQGAIKNCTNSGSVINKVTTNGNENIRVGGIIGCIRGAYTVVNCDNTGEVKDESLSTGGMMGGIIGGIYIAAIQQLENCDNSGNLSASFNSASSGTVFMGGIVGYNIRAIALNNSATAAKNCHNTGNIANNRTTAGAEYVGGWIGYSKWKVLAENCSSSSTIKTAYPTTTKYIGAFAGHLDANNSNIKNCQVGGSFNETPLTADNFASLCFGTDSKYKTTSSITLK